MNKKDKLKSLSPLSDDELLGRLSSVLKQSRRVESVLVAHIAEVDARRLYAREASSSMFKYCVDVLHLSEAEAFLRIATARASRRHPVLLTMLDDGRLHLSGITVLAPHLTDTNCEELLARATHKTKRELLVLAAEIAPKPDVSPSIRKLPKRRQKPASELRTSGAEGTPSGKSPAPEPERAPAPETADKPPVVEPLAPSRYRVQFTASADLQDKLQRLAALMPGADLACSSITTIPTRSAAIEVPTMSDFYVVRNLYMAEIDYGKGKMEQYRRAADRVGEPKPSFPLFPDRVHESPPLRAAVQLATKDRTPPRAVF